MGGLPSSSRALSTAAAQPFNLSDIGEGISEVEIVQWFVKAGDRVEEFDRLVEVQSDKATVEITSPLVGTITSLAYEAGAMAQTGSPLLHIVVEPDEDDAAAPAPAAAAPAAAAPAAAAAAPAAAAAVTSGGKVLATPATRAMAMRHGLDLGVVPGTGKDGRVTKEDVINHMNGVAPAAPAAAAAAAPPAPAAPAAAAAPAAPLPVATLKSAPLTEDRVEPIRGIRKAMFTQMTAALAVPHFGFKDEVRSRPCAMRHAARRMRVGGCQTCESHLEPGPAHHVALSTTL